MSDIRIVEKPDWVTWEAVRECLLAAHDANRGHGIVMAHHQWSAEKMRDSLRDGGVLFVALDGEKLVGTAGLGRVTPRFWYETGKCGNICFDSVLPDYAGQGVFRQLDVARERFAREQGYEILLFDTHARNLHRQRIARKAGYRLARYFRAYSRDHFNVVLVKWLKGCPYSAAGVRVRFWLAKGLTRLQYRRDGTVRGSRTSRFCKNVNVKYFRYYYDV